MVTFNKRIGGLIAGSIELPARSLSDQIAKASMRQQL